MKKALFALILAGGLLASTSCSKDFVCSFKLNGEVFFESTVEVDEGKKCSDMNTSSSLLGHKGEVKCTRSF